MRLAELVMAIVMAVFSIYLMWLSTELEIGWIKGEGPGGGAWSFWLSLGMLLSCLWVIFTSIRGTNQFSESTEKYMDAEALKLFILTAGSVTVMVGLIHIIGVYFSVPLFLIFYMRVMGNHNWRLTGTVAVTMPLVTFLFFEKALTITLPKGVQVIEELFYPFL
ncbi:MAG: tripartite tricarboxylate transporter TctB family protein [Rhodospirillales bacterium]|jgi:putative tricarboxylic transport membrane protein